MPKLIQFLILSLMFSCGEKPAEDDDDNEDEEESDHEGDNAGECMDGIDNDGDGFIDCDDQDCLTKPACNEGDTDTDTDSDTDTDTGDTTGSETDCSDGADNDADGLFDCADPDCNGSSDCSPNTDDATSDYDGAYIGNYQYSIMAGACDNTISLTQAECETAGATWTATVDCGLLETALLFNIQDGTVSGTGFPGTTDCDGRASKLDFLGTVRLNDGENTGEDVQGLASGTYSEAQTMFFNGNWEGTVTVCAGCGATGEDTITIIGTFEELLESTTFGQIMAAGSFNVVK